MLQLRCLETTVSSSHMGKTSHSSVNLIVSVTSFALNGIPWGSEVL